MPRYKCTRCGHDWARGGKMCDCPRCGLHGPHICCLLGFSGVVSSFHLASLAKDQKKGKAK